LPPGRYLIGIDVFGPQRWDPVEQPTWYPNALRPSEASIVEVGEEGSQHLDLRFATPPEEVWFSGVIIDTLGRPISGGVSLYDIDRKQVVSNASADYVGRFRLRGWKGHRYTLRGMLCGLPPQMQSEQMQLPDDPAIPLRVVLSEPCPPK
jgi:hypothetical protein